MSRKTRTWGVWAPVPGEDGMLGGAYARPLEWWPSGRAAEASLRARVPQTRGTVNTDSERFADGRLNPSAQFYGDHDSVIYLYQVTGEPGAAPRAAAAPYAVLEYGPRCGVRRRPLTPAPKETP